MRTSINSVQFFIKIKLQIIFILFLMTACRNQQQSSIPDIKILIDSFYSSPMGDYRLADRSRLSKTLSGLLDEAIKLQSADSARLKSIGSTDKPFMLEGDLFTSLYEGCTSYQIKEISKVADSYKATIQFTNQQFESYTWSDTVLFILEGDQWKIEDVLYTKGKGAGTSTKNVLSQFIQTAQATPAETTTPAAQDSPVINPVKTALRTGEHRITLQWIGWDKPGAAKVVALPNGTYSIQGVQSGETDAEYLKIEGILNPQSEALLNFKGKIQTRISYLNEGKECLREGNYAFKQMPGKKYWRLQEKTNCEGGQTTDYIDIYF